MKARYDVNAPKGHRPIVLVMGDAEYMLSPVEARRIEDGLRRARYAHRAVQAERERVKLQIALWGKEPGKVGQDASQKGSDSGTT